MIDIAPDTACMLYVGVLIMVLFCIWLRTSQKVKKREIVKMTAKHVLCEYCSSPYMVDSFTSLHRCPFCQCINKLRD